jgi:retron-type reverse transcriptase
MYSFDNKKINVRYCITVADPRMIRLLRKWLNAGVMEDGRLSSTEIGTPQGGVISPLLANVFLHYALDE